MLLFQNDDDEEEEVPLVKKRKNPSTSQKGDEEIPDHQAKEAKKKKKIEEPKAQQTPTKVQGDEGRKKKKKEKKEIGASLRGKTVIKKAKVPRVLKIHTPSDSEESPKPKDTPQPEPVVEDPTAINQREQDGAQDDGAILTSDAPNAEERDDALNDPGVEGKKVQLHLFSYLHFSSILYCVNRLLLLFAE
jgi:hypothetical protein